ncbi:MAG TPA: bile acid:sodium symporter family protein [Thioalkalivibrio sp.]|nr:bile acid:sodium symporter family protein [Thioalkalivibrio sp.]
MRAILLFPLFAIGFALLAWALPAPFVALKPAIPWLLALVMFGMGMTLRAADFGQALARPGLIGLGLGLQFLVMPLAAWGIGEALGLPAALLTGLVLVGASPGGTASNVICYLARGDVALSITLTTFSTLLAVVATPLLTWLYVGQRIEVPAGAMLVSVAQIVLLPVALGVAANSLLGRRLAALQQAFPAISMAAIVLIIAIVVALNADRLPGLGALLLLAVILHNAMGLAAGYVAGRLFGFDRRIARTLAIEVGMQNSGLAVALATKYFAPAAALPGALFSVLHNLSGAALAAVWSRRGD